MAHKKLWIALGVVLVISFAVLGGVGVKVLTSAPPISESPGAAGGRGILWN
jgi:nitric oxide reductase large subunit